MIFRFIIILISGRLVRYNFTTESFEMDFENDEYFKIYKILAIIIIILILMIVNIIFKHKSLKFQKWKDVSYLLNLLILISLIC